MIETEPESVWMAVLKAALVTAVSVAPVFLYLYLEEPRFRWAVDDWWAERRHRLAMLEWRHWWSALPGWQQEAWNSRYTLPAELQQRAPGPLFGGLIGED